MAIMEYDKEIKDIIKELSKWKLIVKYINKVDSMPDKEYTIERKDDE